MKKKATKTQKKVIIKSQKFNVMCNNVLYNVIIINNNN